MPLTHPSSPTEIRVKSQIAAEHALAIENYSAARQLLVQAAAGKGDEMTLLANTVADALEVGGDQRELAERLSEQPYHAIYDAESTAIVDDVSLPSLLLAIGEPDLAIERLAFNLGIEPANALYAIWLPQFDPIRCGARFQEIISSFNVVDRRATRICSRDGID